MKEVIEATKILSQKCLEKVEQFGLEEEVKKGFVMHQLEKIAKTFKVITFAKVCELIGMKIEDIELIIAESSLEVQIDREEETLDRKSVV